MRYSKDHKSETRARILKTASARLRSHGASGIGVAELMKEAGLTHGGFYAHFESRDALIGEAFAEAMKKSPAKWKERADRAPEHRKLAAIIENYVSAEHRDDAATGCILPSLGVDVARSSPQSRRVYAKRLEEMIALIVKHQSDGAGTASREDAIGSIAAMVGSLVLARAAGRTKLSDEILRAGRKKAMS